MVQSLKVFWFLNYLVLINLDKNIKTVIGKIRENAYPTKVNIKFPTISIGKISGLKIWGNTTRLLPKTYNQNKDDTRFMKLLVKFVSVKEASKKFLNRLRIFGIKIFPKIIRKTISAIFADQDGNGKEKGIIF